MTEKIAAVYQYRDLAGVVVHETVRFTPKRFTQRRPNGHGGYIYSLSGIEPVLYRLPEITRAIKEQIPIFIVEGEKDVNNLVKIGFEATTCPMGAGRWRDSYTASLTGALALICPDKDETGWKHGIDVADAIYFKTEAAKVVRLPGPGKDVTDWIEAGGTAEQLMEIADDAPIHMPLDYMREYDAWLKVMKPTRLLEELEWLKAAPIRHQPKLPLIEYQLKLWREALAYRRRHEKYIRALEDSGLTTVKGTLKKAVFS